MVGSFKVGDIIIVKRNNIDEYSNIKVGMTGKVVDKYTGGISVEFKENIGGHTCSGRAKQGHGWNISKFSFEYLEIYNPKKNNLRWFA